MRMGYDLSLEQQQKLIMTPELKMALKILQLPSIELEELIEHEIQSNPVLEIAEEYRDEHTVEKTKEEKQFEEKKADKEIDWKEYLQYQGKSYCLEQSSPDDTNENPYENMVSYSMTLIDFLMGQLQMSSLKGIERSIAEYIIDSLNENGYLTISTKDIANSFKKTEDDVEEILAIIQNFEPCGVGARDLKECLLIQLENHGCINQRILAIVENHLDDLAGNRIQQIGKKLGISNEETQKLTDIIKALEPKPGRAFASSMSTKYITPDAYIEKIDNQYVIIINDQYSSKLTINQYYRNILNAEEKDTQAIQYISDKLSSASWLIKSLEHRKNTLYSVIEAIVEYQRGFFDYGVTHLKTLTLKKIADKVDVHESTVSRAISGKYVQTPRGVFEIKYFFKSGVDNNQGDSVSSETIKDTIKKIIEGEKPAKPYSDQDIAEKLTSDSLKISRRTVAKYRDELGILSSSKRKRY